MTRWANKHGTFALVGARRAFAEEAQRLVGLRLAAVRYVGNSYDDAPFEHGDEVVSLDYGVELVGHDGRVVGLTWDSAFRSFSIGIWEGGIAGEGHAVWDVSESARWSSLVGEELTGVDVEWTEDSWVDVPRHVGRLALRPLSGPILESAGQPAGSQPRLGVVRRAQSPLAHVLMRLGAWMARLRGTSAVEDRVCPLAITLRFGERRVWVAAITLYSDGDPWYGGDEIVVTFDELVARRLGLPTER